MKATYAERLKAIKWSGYRTAYGTADSEHILRKNAESERWGSVSEELLRLASSDPETSLTANHHLWCSLCHQHAYVSSAALPALPFLLEVLDGADDILAIEVLDILAGIASCARAGYGEPAGEWILALRERLSQERSRFEGLATHPNEDIRDWAQRILAELAT